MLSIILGWIPVLGPIVQGLSSIFTGYFSEKTVALQTGAQVVIAETQASAQIIKDTSDDICLRFLRDIYCTPAVVQVCLTGWDNIVVLNSWKWMKWGVAAFPPSLEWYPMTVGVFLLGNIGLNMWKRK